ncbi:phospho-sugar mutase [Alkalibacter rhizosphaerae]|uniref:Phosphoglucomutase n=1 Tax=Alkalibacter rhizosphaerae TaxID=2815577 RepID=A0A974XDM4_9FIRM|nr:phospho-sugar mutase [Alkalibacter rhizosphaerae]QSX07796.1 phospho-sugar mutase [Alkalibacter rhizosphaerae]
MYSEERSQMWLDSSYVKEEDKEEIRAILGQPAELEDRFYKDLEFGTAGLRGIMGMGTNRMNTYVVDMTTQALANYIAKKGEKAKGMGVVIAYDSRNQSEKFARSAAAVLAGNQIKTYLFDSLRSVPQLSFAIRHLNCISGIVITASHNPPAYNGYKVYWKEGYQITPEAAVEISEEISDIHDFSMIRTADLESAKEQGILQIISEDVDAAYMKEIMKGITRRDLIQEQGSQLKIVYTALHGSGNVPVLRGLKEAGFDQVYSVKKQEAPDGNFPTVREPNPEKKEVFALAMELGKEVDADILLGTDPDADRLGVAYKNETGDYRLLSGNEIGILLSYYLLKTAKEQERLSEKGVIIKSIVSTELVENIAKDFGVKVINVLTGFKYIGELVEEYSRTKVRDFIFGFEESYGYLPGTHCRDKDAIMTSLVLCEMALHCKSQNKTLGDVLEDIYETYGYCLDDIMAMEMAGKEGAATIGRIVDYFRKNMPMKWGERRVNIVEDYLSGKRNLVGVSTEDIGLPKSNVIKAYLEDGSWFCVRPSGTEPKIKIYFSIRGNSVEEAAATLQDLKSQINQKISDIRQEQG